MRALVHVHENGGCAGADGVTLERLRLLGEYERWMLHEPAGGGRVGFRGALRDAVHSYAEALRSSDPAAYEPFLFNAAEQPEKPGGA